MKPRRIFRVAATAVLAMLACIGPASAQTTYTWTGATNTDWATSSNWNPSTGTPTTTTATAVITTGTSVFSTGTSSIGNLQLNGATALTQVTGGSLTLNTTGGSSYVLGGGGLEIAGGSLLIQGGSAWFSVGDHNSLPDGTGTLTLTSGSFTNNNSWGITVGSGSIGAGTININGGVFTANDAIQNGIWLGESAGGNGTLNLNGGVLITDRIRVGSGTGTLNFNGGKLQATGDLAEVLPENFRLTTTILAGGLIVGGTPNFTIAEPMTGIGGLTKEDGNVVTLTAANSYTGTTTVNSGTLVLGHGANAIADTAPINVNGGVLSLGANSDTVAAVTLTSGSITSSTGVLTGSSYALRSGVVSGILGGGGALTKTTSGTVALSGANTLSGAATIEAGALNVTGGATPGSTLLVGNGATTASMSVSNATVARTGLIQVGQGTGVGVLNVSSGTLSTTGEIWLGSNANAAGFGSMTISGGTVSTGSWLALGRGDAGAAGFDTRGVLNVTGGSLTVGSGGSLSIGAFRVSGTATSLMSMSSGTVNVALTVFVGENGSGILDLSGGTVNVGTVATNNGVLVKNTMNLRGGTLSTFFIGNRAGGTSILNLNGGTLAARNNDNSTFLQGLAQANVFSGGVTVDTAGRNITIGQALIAPAGNGITSTGLTVSGSNYVTAPIVDVTGGGGTGATAVATIDASGNLTGITITNPGTGYTSAPTFTLVGGGGTGAVSGSATLAGNTSGGLTKTGTGTLTLAGVNTYTGTTTVNSGTLLLGNATDTLAATAPINVNGGVLDLAGNTDSVGAVMLTSGTITGSTGVLTGSSYALQSGAVSGRLGGVGALTKTTSGTVTLSGANTLSGAATIEAGALNVTGGAAPGSTLLVGNGATTASMSVSNAAVARTGLIQVGQGTGVGVLNVSSGTLSTTGEIWLGSNANAAGFGSMTISGGTVSTGSWLALGRGDAGAAGFDTRGVLNVTGGSLTVGSGGGLSIGAFRVSGTATSLMSMSSGTVNVTPTLSVGGNASGILDLSGGTVNVGTGTTAASVEIKNTMNLRGGTLSTPSVINRAGGTSILNLNGGTLAARTDTTTFLQGLAQANVFSGGAIVDTAGRNITIGQALIAPAGNGITSSGLTVSGSNYVTAPIVDVTGGGGTGATAVATIDASGNLTGITITNPGTGYTASPTFTLVGGGGTGSVAGSATLVANTSGGLTKQGLGTLLLSGSSSYTGPTTVSAGVLAVNGSLGATNVSVASGATLGGAGVIGGPTSILAGGILAPGNSPGTLTFTSSLTLDNTSILNFELNPINTTVGDGINDLIVANSSLTLDGILNISGTGDFLTATQGSTWRLFNYTGTLTNNTLEFGTTPTLADGLSFNLDTSTAGQVNLVIVPEPASLALAACGLAAAGLVLRRRTRTLAA